MSDINNGRVCACEGAGAIWEIFALASQLCCKSKTAQKIVLKTNKPKAMFLGKGANKYGLDLEAGTRSK